MAIGIGFASYRIRAVISDLVICSCRFSFASTSREMWLWSPSLSHHSALWRTSRLVIMSDLASLLPAKQAGILSQPSQNPPQTRAQGFFLFVYTEGCSWRDEHSVSKISAESLKSPYMVSAILQIADELALGILQALKSSSTPQRTNAE